MASRERASVFTQIATDDEIELPNEFVFKGAGKGHVPMTPPTGENVSYQWSEKGSYRLKQMLHVIENLPQRATPFTHLSG